MFKWWANFSLPQRSGLNHFNSSNGDSSLFVQLRPPDCAEDVVPIVGSTGNGMFR